MKGSIPAKKDNNSVALCWDETEEKDVLGATVVALWSCVAQRRFGVECYFLVLGADKVVDDVRARRVATRVAEPFAAHEALHDAGRIVDAAVARTQEYV
jgi:mannose-1-phosphate guanylyltransferase